MISICSIISACAKKSVDSTEQQSQESIVDPFIGNYHSIIIKVLHPFYRNLNCSDLYTNTILLFYFWYFIFLKVYCLFIVYEVDIPAETLEPGPSETLTAEDTSSASQHAVICALFQFILWKIKYLINIEHKCPLNVYIW